ncbi:chemotaxis protein [Paracidovorax citrulli]|nr:chemotaxis protein [Paracidovorax citrulli]
MTAIASGFLFLRQYLSRGAADRADDAGRVSAINVYKELLEAERAARAQADKRADEFAKERNEAVTALGKLQGQLEGMQRQLQHATEEITSLQAQVRELTEQVHAKT